MSCDWRALENNGDYDDIPNGKAPATVRCAVDPLRVCDDILLMTLIRDVTRSPSCRSPPTALVSSIVFGSKFELFKNMQSRFNVVFTIIFAKQELLIEVLIRRSFSVFVTWIERSNDSRITSCWWASHVHIILKKQRPNDIRIKKIREIIMKLFRMWMSIGIIPFSLKKRNRNLRSNRIIPIEIHSE